MSDLTRLPRLGVNIDHVATLRNARGGDHPDPVRAAQLAIDAGADGITVHLREDRRHIRDLDVERLKAEIDKPMNLEIAATEDMLAIALRIKPHACCVVPENRLELTTEGGLNAKALQDRLQPIVDTLKETGIRVSLFLEADEEQVAAAASLGVDIVELHTGAYCDAVREGDLSFAEHELERLETGAALIARAGIEVHAGHGLNYETVEPVAAIPQIAEFNIGHFLVGEALFEGLDGAVKSMKRIIAMSRHALLQQAQQQQ